MDAETDVKLYEAAITGNVAQFHDLLLKDANILDRVMLGGTPKDNAAHIASQFGHANFVREICSRKAELARQLNSQGKAPLHLASEKGHVEVVNVLLQTDATVCFVRDREGRTALHIAAMRGRLKVLEELVGVRPMAAWVLTDQGDPILHLCANHDQFEALKMLMEKIVDKEFLELKDKDDNTILHLLTATAQHKEIKHLLHKLKTGSDVVNSVNVNGATAMDVAKEIRGRCRRLKIKGILAWFGAKRAKELRQTSRTRPKKWSSQPQLEGSKGSLNKSQDALMVVAILIVTVTYGGVLNLPDFVKSDKPDCQKATPPSPSIQSNFMPSPFATIYFLFNTIAFLVSTILMLVLVSRSSFRSRVLKRYLTIMTWIAVSALLVTYTVTFSASAEAVGPLALILTVLFIVVGWILIIALSFFVFMFRFVNLLVRILGIVRLLRWMVSLIPCRSHDSRDQSSSTS